MCSNRKKSQEAKYVCIYRVQNVFPRCPTPRPKLSIR